MKGKGQLRSDEIGNVSLISINQWFNSPLENLQPLFTCSFSQIDSLMLYSKGFGTGDSTKESLLGITRFRPEAIFIQSN